MRIQGSRIQEAKYQPKTAKKTVLRVKPKSELLKKKDYKNFFNGSSSFA